MTLCARDYDSLSRHLRSSAEYPAEELERYEMKYKNMNNTQEKLL